MYGKFYNGFTISVLLTYYFTQILQNLQNWCLNTISTGAVRSFILITDQFARVSYLTIRKGP